VGLKLKHVAMMSGLAVAIASGVMVYSPASESSETSYTTDRVQRGDIENVVLADGVVYPSKIVNVGAQISGQIETIEVSLGDEVKQGDPVATIDNLAQQNFLKEAYAELSVLNAQYEAKQAQIVEAQSSFDRYKTMLNDGATSKSLYDSSLATLLVNKAELDQLSAQKEKALITVDNAKLNLSYTVIDAPIDGTTIYVSVEEGQTVNNNQGTPSIVELANLDVMTIKAQVSEADIIDVMPGQEVYFSILGSNEHSFTGTLRAIEPGPTILTGDDIDLKIGNSDAIYYNALFDVENPDRILRIGMTAQVSIVLDKAEDALLVPSQVLVQDPRRADRFGVPVLRDGEVVMAKVEVGINNNVYAQILSGLDEGDEIVLGSSSVTSRSSGGMQGQGQGAGGPPGGGPGGGGAGGMRL
jgi:macrolide-specific efflux system membrane fusion protein